MSRVKTEDDYSINDWYSASRESRAISMAVDNQRAADFQQAHNVNPMPVQNFINAPPQQRYVNEPTGPHLQNGGPMHRQQPRLQPVHDHYQQQRTQINNGGNVYFSDTGSYSNTGLPQPHYASNPSAAGGVSGGDHYDIYNDYSDKPVSSHSMMTRTNVTTAPRDRYDPGLDYRNRPTTASTIGSAYAMGGMNPAEMNSNMGQQQLLPQLAIPSNKENYISSEPSTATAGYSPPEHPSVLANQYSATSQLSRNKTINDRYTRRNAGGDSCFGECCESCCGRFMRCTCCCLHPIISWLLVIAVLVGIALALYFNWDKIAKTIDKLDSVPSATASSASGEVPTPTDIISTVSDLISSVISPEAAPATPTPAPVPAPAPAPAPAR
ncbi:hypothetical protein GGI07_001758 [Coemansia sp. Benny D115]|nr:hypothetical protein GGI07_001758 [Coemansia sp. Benny D115]